MANRETNIQRRIADAVSGIGRWTRVFRNNVGTGWVGCGRPIRVDRPTKVELRPGDVLLRNARPLHAGLREGSADLIGWHGIEITPDMVGKRLAIFLSVEVKTEDGETSREQDNWQEQVRAAGGISMVARSPEEAVELVRRARGA